VTYRSLAPLAGLLAVSPDVALGHDAFGDLGPFYGALLHPLADPTQGLIVAAIAVLLARQPIASVRWAWIALAIVGALTVGLGLLVPLAGPGLFVIALSAAGLGILALTGSDLGLWPSIVLSVGAAVLAGLAVDLPDGTRAAALAAFGGMVGISLGALLVWGLVDLLQTRFGRVAGAVVGSWIAAIGTMAIAFSIVAT